MSRSSRSGGDNTHEGNFLSACDYDSDPEVSWAEHFEAFCASDKVSLSEMKRMTEEIFVEDFEMSVFFHLLCLNKKVNVEIIEHLLSLFQDLPDCLPGGATLPNVCMSVDMLQPYLEGCYLDMTAFPVHLACLNEHCPGDVILLLLEKGSADALLHFCDKGEVGEGMFIGQYGEVVGCTPLHFYLGRKKNVELEVVKKLLAYNPQLLLSLSDDNTKCTPIHTLMSNPNLGAMYDIIEHLVEACPKILRLADINNQIPLHIACSNDSVSCDIVGLLLNGWPDSINKRDLMDNLPLHHICRRTKELDEEVSLKILRLLLDADPSTISTREDGEGALPIHLAAGAKQGPQFCKVLIEAYPESIKIADECGSLPINHACSGLPETLKYLLKEYPEGLHVRDKNGFLPIHSAASYADEHSIEIIRVLMEADPDCVTKVASRSEYAIPGLLRNDEGSSPLHLACANCHHSGVAKFLFDVYPEAVLARNQALKRPIDVLREEDARLPTYGPDDTLINPDLRQRNLELLDFLSNQTNCALRAQNRNMMMSEDFSGRLPLYHALCNRARLGVIKLVYNGYPEAFGKADRQDGRYPLDVAVSTGSVEVVKYLAEKNEGCLDVPDPRTGDYPLHQACDEGNCSVIKYLLERPMETVAMRNSKGKLPIQLFCEFVHETMANRLDPYDPESTDFTDTIRALLLAYPETVTNW